MKIAALAKHYEYIYHNQNDSKSVWVNQTHMFILPLIFYKLEGITLLGNIKQEPSKETQF